MLPLKCNMAGTTNGANFSGAPEFNPGFSNVCVAQFCVGSMLSPFVFLFAMALSTFDLRPLVTSLVFSHLSEHRRLLSFYLKLI
jgi:hypothetical protein